MTQNTEPHDTHRDRAPRDTTLDADVVVVGAGVVGAAIARSLATAGHDVLVLERRRAPGLVGTSRNSGVVHAGLYYAEGSRKARTSVLGRRLLWAFAAQRGVPHAKIGKLVVATSATQVEALHALHDQARRNDVEGLRVLSGSEALARCPALRDPHAALWSAESGVVDPVALTAALLSDARAHGAREVYGVEVAGWSRATERTLELTTSTGERARVRHVVSAAGFEGSMLARRLGLDVSHRACIGRWVRVSPSPRLSHLVYPMRSPGEPGLGVHATLDLGGRVRFGPDALWAPPSVDDEASAAAFASASLDAPPPPHVRAAIERLFGPLGDADVSWDDAGVRAKLVGPGDPDGDFELLEDHAGGLHLLGIESPGLTAALALAEEIRLRLA